MKPHKKEMINMVDDALRATKRRGKNIECEMRLNDLKDYLNGEG